MIYCIFYKEEVSELDTQYIQALFILFFYRFTMLVIKVILVVTTELLQSAQYFGIFYV